MHSAEQQHDDLVASPPTHTTPVLSQEDSHPEMSSLNSIPFHQSLLSNKALKNENEDYRHSLKYQSEAIKLLRKTYPDSSTLRSHQDHRDDDWATNDPKDYGFCDGWGMFHTFQENRGNMGWDELGNCDNVNSKEIIIYDDSIRERTHGKENAHERSLEDDSASIKVEMLKREMDNMKMKSRLLQREKDEKYTNNQTSSLEGGVSPGKGEEDDLALNCFDDEDDKANDSSKLEEALLKEKEDHLRTLSKIDKIVGLKEQEITGLDDKLSDQQGLVAEMLDTNGALTQRISELERRLEEDHRLRMEERSEDAKRFAEGRLTGEVRAGVAGKTSEVFDDGLTDVSEDKKGSEPKYYGW
ncbi:uncharacterized protein L199_006418 [Kwoniella botswanensis]|uniref:uncharacterized protein n=1 Tax=Kwoniella botswanensis TaxID=1268659 RepID=UPI00315C7896